MGKYCITKSKAGFKFSLEAANGTVVAMSQSAYSTKTTCKSAIASMKKIANSPIEDQTAKGFDAIKKPKYEVFQDRKKAYGFRLVAANGSEIIVNKGYESLEGCKNGIASIQSNINSEIVDKTLKEKKREPKKTASKKNRGKKSGL